MVVVVMADAPELHLPYEAPEHYVPLHEKSAPITPSSPSSHYEHDGLQVHDHYAHSRQNAMPFVTPLLNQDSESLAAEPTRKLRDRRVCGIPLLLLIAISILVAIVVILGGTLGGVLGKKKAPVAAAATEPTPSEAETPTTYIERTSSETATPTPTSSRTPNATSQPRLDSWYYLKNDLVTPDHAIVEDVIPESGFLSVSQQKGDSYEHWGFWPVSRNTTLADRYRQEQSIDAPLYLMYNRGMTTNVSNMPPDMATLENQKYWWWFEDHPIGGYVYLKNGKNGPDFAYTVQEVGKHDDIDMVRYHQDWDRTNIESLMAAQAWKLELAFAHLKGEKPIFG